MLEYERGRLSACVFVLLACMSLLDIKWISARNGRRYMSYAMER
jgi:hypothetical protein